MGLHLYYVKNFVLIIDNKEISAEKMVHSSRNREELGMPGYR